MMTRKPLADRNFVCVSERPAGGERKPHGRQLECLVVAPSCLEIPCEAAVTTVHHLPAKLERQPSAAAAAGEGRQVPRALRCPRTRTRVAAERIREGLDGLSEQILERLLARAHLGVRLLRAGRGEVGVAVGVRTDLDAEAGEL